MHALSTHTRAQRSSMRLPPSFRSGAGFTLIELILYVGLVSTMMFSMALFLPSLLETRVKNQTVAEVEQQGLQTMQIMTQAIRNADAIGVSSELETSGALVLSVPGSPYPTYFKLSDETIEMDAGEGGDIALTNNRVQASSFTIENLSRANTPGIIRIQFTLSYRNPSGRFIYDFSKTFYGSAARRFP